MHAAPPPEEKAHSRSHKRQPYVSSVIDWWVAGLGAIALVLLAWLMPVLGLGITGIGPRIFAITALLLVAIFITDSFFFLHYRITKDGLLIATHLRHVVVPFRDMEQIAPGGFQSMISLFGHRRFALSAKRSLVISLNKRNEWRSISISPQHQSAFLDQLLQGIDRERSRRVSAPIQ